MYKPRPKEPSYAFIASVQHADKNRYGHDIETVPADSELRNQSLNINYDDAIGDNPDRYKQHGFYFNADNCIACHACEAACSEKNDLPAHIAFRSVGYLEGGSYPAYQRLNISMACNHCDDPVCLKGCPTRAYTKFAEYGAVLQDPDICFGCGYCTWVCPYNAPQLDHEQGHVQKCNMCVDRLEVGLKPACASACLAGALDFGVTETLPENSHQMKADIPGFPDPEITHPNISFQQTTSLPKEMRRTDSMPIRYEKSQHNGYQSKQSMATKERHWSIAKLSTRENPLVVFTLVSQLVVGAFLILFLGPKLGVPTFSAQANPVLWPLILFGLIGIQTLALVMSTMHLGKPHRFYRAFYNLRYSPVSREVAGIAVFYNFLGAYSLLSGLPTLFTWLSPQWYTSLMSLTGWAACVSGVVALYFMYAIYRIPARPFWNHWSVLTTFYGSMLTLGSVTIIILYVGAQSMAAQNWFTTVQWLALPLTLGMLLEAGGLLCHARYLKQHSGESNASHQTQLTTFGYTYWSRNIILMTTIAITPLLALTAIDGTTGTIFWAVNIFAIVMCSVIGRSLFYALVIPTTMPGAFFWKNKRFEEHARAIGLADLPQTGVLPDTH